MIVEKMSAKNIITEVDETDNDKDKPKKKKSNKKTYKNTEEEE